MPMKLLPLPYFVGLALGLMGLSYLGSTVSSTHLRENFVRFHRLISPEAGYFATARQVRSIVDAPTNAKVDVIVGGSSVMNGVGQHETMIWTRVLQEQLGSNFRVLNFAQRAGAVADFGNVAAELLLQRHRSVIYITDIAVYGNVPFYRSWYRHIIFDAWERGYLLPWSLRDRLLSAAKFTANAELRTPALGALLDRYLNFNDLWSYVSYEYANTTWNNVLGEQSFQARYLLADPEPSPDQARSLRYLGDPEAVMVNIRGELRPLDRAFWGPVMRLVEEIVPPRLRAVTLAVVHLDSPFYLSRLSSDQRAHMLAQADFLATTLTEIGFRSTVVVGKDLGEDDYLDRAHLSVDGGRKMAVQLAPLVQEIAVQSGYLR
jgi:hypothetical protein